MKTHQLWKEPHLFGSYRLHLLPYVHLLGRSFLCSIHSKLETVETMAAIVSGVALCFQQSVDDSSCGSNTQTACI